MTSGRSARASVAAVGAGLVLGLFVGLAVSQSSRPGTDDLAQDLARTLTATSASATDAPEQDHEGAGREAVLFGLQAAVGAGLVVFVLVRGTRPDGGAP